MAKKAKAKKKPSDTLLAAAMELKKGELVQLQFDPFYAKQACHAGLDRLSEHQDLLRSSFPGFDMELMGRLPEACDRIADAVRAMPKATKRRVAVSEAIAPALEWRHQLLAVGQALETSHQLSSREVARIEAGDGVNDYVRDVADLIDLLKPHQAAVELVAGKGAFTEAKAAAATALEALGQSPAASLKAQQAVELRDRYATLVVQLHDRLLAAAAAVVGYRNAPLMIPPLSTGHHTGAAAEDTTPAVVTDHPVEHVTDPMPAPALEKVGNGATAPN